MPKARIVLDDDELETILAIARNGQSGRVTMTEIEELVRAYKEMLANAAAARRDGFEEGFEDGRLRGILSVYNGILTYRVRDEHGNRPDSDEMVRRIKETDGVRLWMERVYPIIKQTYPDEAT